jgi:carbon storage regulator CsrA
MADAPIHSIHCQGGPFAMLVLSRRLNEKLLFPGLHTSIQVISIKAGLVRLGIDAPDNVHVLREEVPDRAANWGPAPEEECNPSLQTTKLKQMINRRLEIVRKGLSEAQQLTDVESPDASQLLARVDEDLRLLMGRVKTEFERIGPAAPAEVDEAFSHVFASAVVRSR